MLVASPPVSDMGKRNTLEYRPRFARLQRARAGMHLPPLPGKTGPLPLGTVVDAKYELERVLGVGSAGVVYLAEDLGLERQVALKILSRRVALRANLVRAFREEAVALARVCHPNIVQIHAYGDHDGLPYFVMEHISGRTVAAHVETTIARGQQLHLDEVLGIVGQICRGLQAVHDRGIVHRDVKPANMLIGHGFRVALADFGLVGARGCAPATETLVGTPLYLAPELIRLAPVAEEQRHLADIYALGASIYEMLTGCGPFDGETIQEILACHLSAPPPAVTDRRPDLPSALDPVLARALAKDPLERYPSCRELLDALLTVRRQAARVLRRILVVDGDPGEQLALTAALRVGIPDATVLAAGDGRSALDMVRASRPDLILLDLEVPRAGGLEVCACLGADAETAEIPVLVLSRRLEGPTLSLLRSLGARDVLSKPVEVTEVVQRAQRHLGGTDD